MKTAQKPLALLLVLLTLCLLMVPAAAVESVDHVEARVVTPVIGAPISSLTVKSSEPEKYTATAKVYYWKSGSAYYPAADETFEKGISYYCRVGFSANEGYQLDYSNLTCEIIGQKSSSKVGFSMWEIVIRAKTQAEVDAEEEAYAAGEGYAPDAAPDADLCPYCGKVHNGFIQKIIGFFHSILFRLFGAKKK